MSDFARGTGTSNDPYEIETIEHLHNIRNYNGSHFLMKNNLDLTDATRSGGGYYNDGAGWAPMFGDAHDGFTGVFDGGGYSITGVYMSASATWCLGFFRSIALSGIIRNLKLVSIDFRFPGTADRWSGGFVGNNRGLIENCSVSGSIQSNQTNNSANIGGFCGYNENYPNGIIRRCYSRVNITAQSAGNVGGFIGLNRSIIEDCYSKGNVSGNTKVGGFIGELAFDSFIYRCFATGEVEGNNGIGGFAGAGSQPSFYCFWDTETTNRNDSGLTGNMRFHFRSNPDAFPQGLTTEQMQNINSYPQDLTKDPPEWDIARLIEYDNEIWKISDNSYPKLNWEIVELPDHDGEEFFEDDFTIIKQDPTKNTITMSKMIKNSDTDMSRLFKVSMEKVIRDSNKKLGKLLLEMRISSPLNNYKGYITTGFLEDGYGIGFFSEYNRSFDNSSFFIIAHKEDGLDEDVMSISLIRTTYETDESIFKEYLPVTIQITPLIVGERIFDTGNIKIDQSLDRVLFPESFDFVFGIGDLNSEGHGPIDCKIKSFFELDKYSFIKSKYYPGNRYRSEPCLSSTTSGDIGSKLLDLRIEPTSYNNPETDTVQNSHILKPTFGNSHFDLFNLMMDVYNFDSFKPYRCFGNVIINGVVVPVIGFVLDDKIGRVTFTISPYFKIPANMKNIKGIDTEFRGLKIPLIVFDTNMNSPHNYNPNGLIGDVEGPSYKFNMGYDRSLKAHEGKSPIYDLSLIDITVIIRNCTGNLSGHKIGRSFRYSGNYSKYDYDFTKYDYDSYPYPGDNRDISDRIDKLDEIPSLNPDALVLATADNKFTFVWVDDVNEFISFVNNIKI